MKRVESDTGEPLWNILGEGIFANSAAMNMGVHVSF